MRPWCLILFLCTLFGSFTAMAQDTQRGKLRIRILNPQERVIEPQGGSLKPVDQDLCGSLEEAPAIKVEAGFLEGVIVWIEPQDEGNKKKIEQEKKPKGLAEKELLIENCELKNKLLWLYPGQRLRLKTRDPINYDIRFLNQPKWESFYSIPPSLRSTSTEFSRPGVYQIDGVLHPQIKGTLVVQAHPYYGSTSSQGSVVLERVPVGRYRLHFWHPHLGDWSPRDLVIVSERSQDLESVWPELEKQTP